MRLRRAVPQIPAKSSVPPRLPLHKNPSRLTPSQSTLPRLLIPLRFKSCISNTYKKPRGRGPAANPKVCQLVNQRAARLHTRRNPRNPSAFIELLHNLRTPRGWGLSLLCALCALCVKNHLPTSPYLGRFTQADPHTSSLSRFTTHHPLVTRSSSFQGKIYPSKSRSHHV
jgi:hypothetical protein